MDGKLQKPVFSKVDTLTDCKDGFNVLVKVVGAEHENSQNGNQNFVRAVVADETGAAQAFFKGESAELIQKDQVIAIRNGRIKIIKSHISLEIDIFGRVTKETADIKVNLDNNISEKEINKPRRNANKEGNRKPREEGERRPRREDGDRKPREEGERRPRREDGDRKPREEGERRPRREDGDRKPREEGERKPREEGERRPRREDGERGPRREDGDRKPREDRPRREEGERGPRREEGARGPRRDEGPRREGDRPRMEWTKIGAVEPGDERLNITAKVP